MQKQPKVYPGEIIHLYDVVPVLDKQTGNYIVSVNEKVLDEMRKALELLYANRAAARNTPKKREARKMEGDKVFVQYRITYPENPQNVEPKVFAYNVTENNVLNTLDVS